MRLGPQAQCAYRQLYQRITAGLLPPGTKLPPQADLAPALGVSLLTLRQALDQLEQEGLIATSTSSHRAEASPALCRSMSSWRVVRSLAMSLVLHFWDNTGCARLGCGSNRARRRGV